MFLFQFVAVLNSKKIKLKELKKEIEKWKIQPESKVERDDTTSSSSGEDEKEIDHQEVLRSSSNKSIRVWYIMQLFVKKSKEIIIYTS